MWYRAEENRNLSVKIRWGNKIDFCVFVLFYNLELNKVSVYYEVFYHLSTRSHNVGWDYMTSGVTLTTQRELNKFMKTTKRTQLIE